MSNDPSKPLFNVISPDAAGCGCGLSPPLQGCCPPPESNEPPLSRSDPETDAPAEADGEALRAAAPRISSSLDFGDRLGAFKARWGIGRMSYAVPPGVYALGSPTPASDVLVTANYKLTFDKLRSALEGHDLWILVLDTIGVNVWCAAGKGTFGTEELVRRISETHLGAVVSHRRIIVPQLGAPGVAAHEVRSRTGFRVVWGPIRAADIPAFLRAGRKATPEMRKKDFPLSERIVLIPVELVQALKWMVLLQVIFVLASGLGGAPGMWTDITGAGALSAAAILAAVVGGAVLTPVLLPVLPGRAFSLKSLPVAAALLWGVLAWLGTFEPSWRSRLELVAWILIVPALTSFLAMNFTGASTYTSLSGVRKEMRIAVPLQIGAASIGLTLWIASRVVA